ncbi:hypothetical protein JVT61DRAFT_9590 [Boletus reticuloceps]|uniref:Uncharacterized protein n=1 Tax=Boletus reticuloceps TaxID=495285 RepID=A0A8I2YGJ3_9AGAM|nr:hypothetical protein JVT61DRAFT_9590 [Boletus reticuloceps]
MTDLLHSSQTIPPVRVVQSAQSLYASVRKLFKMQANRFGLFRIYNSNSPPRYDPEDPYLVENMCSPCIDLEQLDAQLSTSRPGNPFYPYPNESSMRLGNWYWNEGAQKSKENFKELLNIVGDPAFSPSAVSETVWGAIDQQVGRNQLDSDVLEWLGEDDGWKCSSVTISVLFHSQSRSPGSKNYTVDGFYHHSLVSIIKEKITNPVHASLFHLDLYEL